MSRTKILVGDCRGTTPAHRPVTSDLPSTQSPANDRIAKELCSLGPMAEFAARKSPLRMLHDGGRSVREFDDRTRHDSRVKTDPISSPFFEPISRSKKS